MRTSFACAAGQVREWCSDWYDPEVSAVGSVAPGTGLWKVGQRSFVVQHLISEAERWVVDTEPAERPRRGWAV